jgi:hypothetical protein
VSPTLGPDIHVKVILPDGKVLPIGEPLPNGAANA